MPPASEPTFLSLLAGTGLAASGLVSGLTLAYPLIINQLYLDPALGYESAGAPYTTTSVAQRLALWQRSFQNGTRIPFLTVFTSLTWVSLLLADRSSWLTKKQKRLLISSAALSFSLIPFTAIALLPVNSRLMKLRTDAAADAAKISSAEAENLLKRWQTFHNVRVACSLAAFLSSVCAFILP